MSFAHMEVSSEARGRALMIFDNRLAVVVSVAAINIANRQRNIFGHIDLSIAFTELLSERFLFFSS